VPGVWENSCEERLPWEAGNLLNIKATVSFSGWIGFRAVTLAWFPKDKRAFWSYFCCQHVLSCLLFRFIQTTSKISFYKKCFNLLVKEVRSCVCPLLISYETNDRILWNSLRISYLETAPTQYLLIFCLQYYKVSTTWTSEVIVTLIPRHCVCVCVCVCLCVCVCVCVWVVESWNF
jgi:hypothetical protein